MKIAFVNDTFFEGRGSDTVIYELARRMGKKHEVAVICGNSDFKEENFEIKKLGFDKLVTGNAKDFLGFMKLKKFRDACKNYDIINLHHATLTSSFLGRKNVVVTCNGFPKNSEKNVIRKIFRFLANGFNLFMTNFISKTVAISLYIKKGLIKKGVCTKKIVIIYDGVSSEFKPAGKDRGFMLFVGRHEPHKEVHEIIRLSKEINFPLKIAGTGPLTEKLKKYKRRINADKVEFLGKIDRKQLFKLYQECSFFVSASKWEGFGLIFIEAGACAKPSVAYNLCSMPEVIKHNNTGFLAKNYGEFKEYAKRLKEDLRLRKKLGKEAFKFSKNFSWNKTVDKYENLFQRIIEK